MAVPLNTPSHSDRALQALERERKAEADERSTAWAFVWTLFGFKMGTVAIIWYAASGSGEASNMLIVTTWYWLLIPIVAVSGTVAYRWRLIRMRRQRERLRMAEWMESPPHAPGSRGPAGRMLIEPRPPDDGSRP